MTERVSTEKPAPAPASAEPTSKERRWWVFTALRNIGLLLVPAFPAINAVREFRSPSANLRLTDEQREAVAGLSWEGHADASVRRVTVVLEDPALAERVLAALPSALLALMVLSIAWALWRIEVNMTAGPHQRPFTQKDERVLARVSRSLLAWWFVFLVVELAGIAGVMTMLEAEGGYFGPVGDVTFIIFGLSMLFAQFARVYRKGRAAYNDLEKIV